MKDITFQELNSSLIELGFKNKHVKGHTLYEYDKQMFILFQLDRETDLYYIETPISIEINQTRSGILETAKTILNCYLSK